MIAFLFELMGMANFLLANYHFHVNKAGPEWLFCILCSIVLYIASLKYDQETKNE